MTSADIADAAIKEVTERLAGQRELLRSTLKTESGKPTLTLDPNSAVSKWIESFLQLEKAEGKAAERAEKAESPGSEAKKEENDGRESDV